MEKTGGVFNPLEREREREMREKGKGGFDGLFPFSVINERPRLRSLVTGGF